MATALAAKNIRDLVFEWEGKDKNGKIVRGEMRAGGEAMVSASLRRQGILTTKVKKRRMSGGKAIKQKDIAVFTRQLATMMKAGVPLIQSFDIVARGSTNPKLTRLLTDIRTDVETGTSLSSAFRKHPLYFDSLYCNLVEAGEAGGILEALLERLALYQEKTMALKNKIKSALIYPVAVLVVAFVVLAVIMIFVIPAFKEVFTSFGADLPAPTLVEVKNPPKILMEIGEHECKWGLDDPGPGRMDEMLMCAAPTAEGEAYCAGHQRASLNKAVPASRALARPAQLRSSRRYN